jgi:predicted nuclease with RNAse H fold
VVTLGVDLASAIKRTAMCWVRWEGDRAEVLRLDTRADDDEIIAAIGEVDKAGVDVPFGWPGAFVDAISCYNATGLWPGSAPQPNAAPEQLQFRTTDRHVHKLTGRWPLSVSADRIAIPAMRAAAVLSRLAEAGEPVARDGSGRIVEVYPAAALRMWGFDAVGYKRKENRESRCKLLGTIVKATAPWLAVSTAQLSSCEASDDALDALIAAMVARAAAVGLCEEITAEHQPVAMREGWIAMPTGGSLQRLAIGL